MRLALLLFACLRGWFLTNSPAPVVLQEPRGGASFAISQSSTGRFDTEIVRPYIIPLSGTLTFQINVSTTGSPIFNWQNAPDNTCLGAPAAAHPFFSSALNVDDGDSTHRWWAVSSRYVLAPGSATLIVPLTAVNWLDEDSVHGDSLPGAFAAALANVKYIGLTFGGGCFLGHGTNVSGGTATFKIASYSITP